MAKLEGEGEGAPPCSIPRSSSVHPTIGCRAAPLPPLATAPLPGPPRSPHSVLGITACSIELDARRRKERDNDHLPLCAPRIIYIYRSLSLFNSFAVHRPARFPVFIGAHVAARRRGQGDDEDRTRPRIGPILSRFPSGSRPVLEEGAGETKRKTRRVTVNRCHRRRIDLEIFLISTASLQLLLWIRSVCQCAVSLACRAFVSRVFRSKLAPSARSKSTTTTTIHNVTSVYRARM